MAFPATPEALDPDWLQDLLRREGGLAAARVSRVDCERIGEPDHPRVRAVVESEIPCIAEAAQELWPA